jgi:hypothetical protein
LQCNNDKKKNPSKVEHLVSSYRWRSPLRGTYSFHTHKESRLEQQHGLQNLTLTPCFYKSIYQKMVYVYFYEIIFQDKSIYMVIHDLYSQYLTQTLSKTTFFIGSITHDEK